MTNFLGILTSCISRITYTHHVTQYSLHRKAQAAPAIFFREYQALHVFESYHYINVIHVEPYLID